MSFTNGSQSSRFAGRVGIVTGASSGMGRGIALNLAREGATVVCSDLRPEANPKGWEEDVHIPTHEVITNNGGTAIFVKADVSVTADIANLIEEAVKNFGKLDFLVNVAGLWLPLRKYVDETEEMWDKMFGINAKGTGTAMRLAIQQFLKQDVDQVSGARGRIVNISSSAGITAIGGETTYAASKAAVVMLTRNAALDHAKDYINVNCVCPGVVKTGMSRSNWDNPETIKAMMAGTPWPRLGEPHDIAKVVNFLLSEDAQWMTGQTLAVDGGFTVGIPLAF